MADQHDASLNYARPLWMVTQRQCNDWLKRPYEMARIHA